VRRDAGRDPVIVLDAGNALMGYWLSQASGGTLIREAMDEMGYDAMAVGGLDLTLGVEALRAVADGAAFSVLSANLVERETGRPVFAPYIVVHRGDVRVGVIGLTENDALEGVPDGEAYEVLLYDATLSAYLADVTAQSDVVVLLSHVGLYDDKLLAERFDAIDVIVGGRNARRMVAPEIIGETIIVQLGARGEELGLLQLALDDKMIPLAHEWRVIPLGPEYPDDPAMSSLVHRYRQTLRPPTDVPTREASTP
jgi:2',3'-cyclic-nucleotide 2'-phosphodiesterase (5'-nucleotidase family)